MFMIYIKQTFFITFKFYKIKFLCSQYNSLCLIQLQLYDISPINPAVLANSPIGEL